tara:strand:+ start:52 stop:534 length:483 start_codon:yes stop_codon:yes gene_type:complete
MATSEFGKAFRSARTAGDKTFMFNGKKYTTDLAPEEQKSVGGKPKLDEYVPRDSDARKGEIMRSKNAVPRDSFAKKSRIEERAMREANAAPAGSEYTSTEDFMGMKDMASKSNYVNDEKMGGVRGGYKHGGKVKKMASGGSASSRGDGIATKGKTRGKMC